MNNQCKFWDCFENISPVHIFCGDHFEWVQTGDIDECPIDEFNDSDGDGLCDSDDLCPFDIDNDIDELYNKAVDIIVSQQKVSTSFIQRYLQIGYNRAARIIEKMEENGIISEANNAGKRQVLKKK